MYSNKPGQVKFRPFEEEFFDVPEDNTTGRLSSPEPDMLKLAAPDLTEEITSKKFRSTEPSKAVNPPAPKESEVLKLFTDENEPPTPAQANSDEVAAAKAEADRIFKASGPHFSADGGEPVSAEPRIAPEPDVLEFKLPATMDGEPAAAKQYIWHSPVKPLKLTNSKGAWKYFATVLGASLPVLGMALFLRLFDFGHQSAYMDEGNYIVTGRIWLEQGTIYANAMQWTFGSLLYPILAGWFDMQGGLNMARLISLFFGLVTVQSTIFLTLGLFKAQPETLEEEQGDFAVSSKPMIASLLAGVIVAVLPTANALSRFATYDAMAAGLFAAGTAAFVWGIRQGNIANRSGDGRRTITASLMAGAAVLLLLAFLTKYVVALYFPFFCLIALAASGARRYGFLLFVMPLSLACAVYYGINSGNLTALLQFASGYKDLKSDNMWQIYVAERLDLLVLMLVGYWGLRQSFRDRRFKAPLLLWGGALVMVIFQLTTRPDYDYWKHSIYLIIFLAPLAGWLWSDWSWWDEPAANTRPGLIQRYWATFKKKYGPGSSRDVIDFVEKTVGGNRTTERPGSYSLALTLAVLLFAGGFLWAVTDVPKLLGHWPSLSNSSLAQIQQTDPRGGQVLVDDSALTYYLYNRVPTGKVINPFFFTYKGASGTQAYVQALRDQQFNLLILNGGATATGKDLSKQLHTALEAIPAYQLVYSEPLITPFMDEAHKLEIYRLLTKEEQDQVSKGVTNPATGSKTTPATTAPAPAATKAPGVTIAASPAAKAAAAPAATVAPVSTPKATIAASPTVAPTVAPTVVPTVAPTVGPVFPLKATYNFDTGDEGWGLLPAAGELQPGAAVSASPTYKLDGHNSLKFTPQPVNKAYTVGVTRTADFHKISMYIYIPAANADGEIRLGLYYFDKSWTWFDNGFVNKIVPGKWNLVTWELDKPASMQQFGLKLVGYSGSIYINGVVVE